MKIILIGSSGTIGKAVYENIRQRHDVICANRSDTNYPVDITNNQSIKKLYEKIGKFDAVVSTAGQVHFGYLTEFTTEQYELGLRNKLMGQVNLVMQALPYIRDNGSFTLTSGLLNDDPIRQGTSAAMINGALEGFVHGAAIELPRGLRINLISPTLIEESLADYESFFPGVKPIQASEAAFGYVKSIEGAQTGRVYRLGWSRDN